MNTGEYAGRKEMEGLILVVLVVFYLLVDAPSAVAAFESRARQRCWPSNLGQPAMIYVFARWLPSQKIRMDLPTIYYIPCDKRDIAEKLADSLHRFGTDKGHVVELPNINDLKKHVSSHYQLTDLELTPFPISTDKLLEGID